MSDVHSDAGVCAATGHQVDPAPHLRAADWLGLAAAPTFALTALLTGVLGGVSTDVPCLGASVASPLSGMLLMYGLMSIFHVAPWLKWIARRQYVIRRT